jgi:hypothetical protein
MAKGPGGKDCGKMMEGGRRANIENKKIMEWKVNKCNLENGRRIEHLP